MKKVFIIYLAIILLLTAGSTPKAGGEAPQEEEVARYQIIRSNESWPVLLEFFREWSPYYQAFGHSWGRFAEFEKPLLQSEFMMSETDYQALDEMNFSEEDQENMSVYVKVSKGMFNDDSYVELRDNWENWNDENVFSFSSKNRYYDLYFKPPELDENFQMNVNFSLMNGSNIIYWEEHVFQVTGEPIVIPGDDFSEEQLRLAAIYLVTVPILGALVWKIHSMTPPPGEEKGTEEKIKEDGKKEKERTEKNGGTKP